MSGNGPLAAGAEAHPGDLQRHGRSQCLRQRGSSGGIKTYSWLRAVDILQPSAPCLWQVPSHLISSCWLSRFRERVLRGYRFLSRTNGISPFLRALPLSSRLPGKAAPGVCKPLQKVIPHAAILDNTLPDLLHHCLTRLLQPLFDVAIPRAEPTTWQPCNAGFHVAFARCV